MKKAFFMINNGILLDRDKLMGSPSFKNIELYAVEESQMAGSVNGVTIEYVSDLTGFSFSRLFSANPFVVKADVKISIVCSDNLVVISFPCFIQLNTTSYCFNKNKNMLTNLIRRKND
jgi:hypothetical protein